MSDEIIVFNNAINQVKKLLLEYQNSKYKHIDLNTINEKDLEYKREIMEWFKILVSALESIYDEDSELLCIEFNNFAFMFGDFPMCIFTIYYNKYSVIGKETLYKNKFIGRTYENRPLVVSDFYDNAVYDETNYSNYYLDKKYRLKDLDVSNLLELYKI